MIFLHLIKIFVLCINLDLAFGQAVDAVVVIAFGKITDHTIELKITNRVYQAGTYVVSIAAAGTSPRVRICLIKDPNCIVNELKADNVYTFTAIACKPDSEDCSAASPSVTTTTSSLGISFVLESRTTHSIKLRWNWPSQMDTSMVVGREIGKCGNPERQCISQSRTRNSYECDFENLESNAIYNFSAIACKEGTARTCTEEKYFVTQTLPEPPRRITGADETVNSARVVWRPPPENGGEIVRYLLKATPIDPGESFSCDVVYLPHQQEQSCELTNLKIGQKYGVLMKSCLWMNATKESICGPESDEAIVSALATYPINRLPIGIINLLLGFLTLIILSSVYGWRRNYYSSILFKAPSDYEALFG